MDTWEPGRALELLQRERIAVMISKPVFMRTMIIISFATIDRSRMRLFSLGGAGVAPAMVREGAEAFDCWCKRTYGSTDTRRSRRRLATTSNATRRPTAAHWRRRVAYRRSADAPRRAARQSGRGLARGPEMFTDTSTPRST